MQAGDPMHARIPSRYSLGVDLVRRPGLTPVSVGARRRANARAATATGSTSRRVDRLECALIWLIGSLSALAGTLAAAIPSICRMLERRRLLRFAELVVAEHGPAAIHHVAKLAPFYVEGGIPPAPPSQKQIGSGPTAS